MITTNQRKHGEKGSVFQQWFRVGKSVMASIGSQAYQFRSTLRLMNAGWLFVGLLPGIWITITSGLRELLMSGSSILSTLALGLIMAECGLFVAIFWAIFTGQWSMGIGTQGLVMASQYAVVNVITVVLSTVSTCLSTLAVKDINQSTARANIPTAGINLLMMAFVWLLITEYRMLAEYPNDSTFLSGMFMVTGVHFGHVYVGWLILTFVGRNIASDYRHRTAPNSKSVPSVATCSTLDSAAVIYMHFVGAAWIGIHATAYL